MLLSAMAFVSSLDEPVRLSVTLFVRGLMNKPPYACIFKQTSVLISADFFGRDFLLLWAAKNLPEESPFFYFFNTEKKFEPKVPYTNLYITIFVYLTLRYTPWLYTA